MTGSSVASTSSRRDTSMSYLSCFSGIGGLEGSEAPSYTCEIDPECHGVLNYRFPEAPNFDDVKKISGVTTEVIVGGWPCQDLSIAGNQKGLSGSNSSLFYDFLEAARRTQAHTVIAENVPNLLKIDSGMVFKEVLSEFYKSGYKYISWRTLNAREFGLPHQRNRVFIVASKHSELCETIFRSIPSVQAADTPQYCGFYWTAGTQSICYSRGYVPAIKVGSSLSIESPPAVHFSGTIRKLTASEVLKLQGFRLDDFQCVEKESSLYRMAGNAVAVPVGRFVVDGVLQEKESGNHSRVLQRSLFSEGADWSTIGPDGYFDGEVSMIERPKTKVLASDLKRFLDLEVESRLSGRAAKGLLKRLRRSNVDCPLALKEDLMAIIEKG